MYAIQWQRITGESGVWSWRFNTEEAARRVIANAKKLDRAKRQGGAFEYNIIEI